jgi:protoporphyrinogen oxidase
VSDSYDVVVLGGGPAGLSAAWRIALAGHSVCVIERADHVGGMAASFEVAGQRVDHGSHRLHRTIEPEILAALTDLLGSDLQRRVRNGRIRIADRWVRFPLRPADLARRLPPRTAAAIGRDLLAGPLRADAREATFAEEVRARLGPTVLRELYGPYAHKLWGVSASELTDELFRRRVSAGSGVGVVRRMVHRERPWFWYPRRGFGQIVDALADAAAGAGVDIVCGATATGVRRDRVVLDDGRTIDCGTVLSTIAPGSLVRLASAPPEVREAATSLRTRALDLLYVALDRDRYTPYDAHYVPASGVPLSRLSEPKGYRDGPDRHDLTVLCAEIPDRVDSTADELGEWLTRIGLPAIDPIETARRRVPAYPLYTPGHDAAMAAVEAWADDAGIVLVGRQARFAHDNTHHALAMGWAAARCVDSAGRWRADRWRTERDRFATHVVED